MISLFHQINALDWGALSDMLDERGYALTSQIVAPEHCRQLADFYDHTQQFRSTVIMAWDGFGRGEYRYFAYQLPSIVATLREVLYPHLAAIASRWSERLGTVDIWPTDHQALIDRCHAFGQCRPAPLLLSYGPGDFNCLHTDLYGPIHFPL